MFILHKVNACLCFHVFFFSSMFVNIHNLHKCIYVYQTCWLLNLQYNTIKLTIIIITHLVIWIVLFYILICVYCKFNPILCHFLVFFACFWLSIVNSYVGYETKYDFTLIHLS